jgi:hypothetical protein
MLRAYFDDSGTHSSSEVVVWGGVVGTVSQFEAFDVAWAEMLAQPLPGKPPLKKFSLSKCASARGEFENYRPEERDALRYKTREIIEAASIRSVAYAVPIRLYDTVLRGRVRRTYGPPSGIAFAACADFALQVSEKSGRLPLTCEFDVGQDNENARSFVSNAESRARHKGVPISYSFAPVQGSYGLQAADTIATEHYWYGLDFIEADEPVMSPHFASLVNMANPTGWVLTRAELEQMKARYLEAHPIRSWLKRQSERSPRR